jgi:hypothetical protein
VWWFENFSHRSGEKVIQKGIKPYFIIIKEFKDYLFAFSPFFRK